MFHLVVSRLNFFFLVCVKLSRTRSCLRCHRICFFILTTSVKIGHKLPHEQWGYIAEYNRVIGGLRIAQHRGETRHCHYDELNEFYGDCHPLDSVDNEDFGYPDCDDSAAVAYYNSKYESVDDDVMVRKCYNTSNYEGAVDLNNNEGFKYDPATGQFEM